MNQTVVRESLRCTGNRAIGVLYYSVWSRMFISLVVHLMYCLNFASSWLRFALLKSPRTMSRESEYFPTKSWLSSRKRNWRGWTHTSTLASKSIKKTVIISVWFLELWPKMCFVRSLWPWPNKSPYNSGCTVLTGPRPSGNPNSVSRPQVSALRLRDNSVHGTLKRLSILVLSCLHIS